MTAAEAVVNPGGTPGRATCGGLTGGASAFTLLSVIRSIDRPNETSHGGDHAMTATTATRPLSNPAELVTDEMLARFDERTMRHDRENSFFHDDFEDLRRAGTSPPRCPPTSAAAASTSAAINRLQRRIAYVAPATAVGVNMHHYFVGLCADLHRAGDPSGDWVLARAAEGDDLRRRARRGRQRHPGAPVVVAGRARRRWVGDHRAQDLRQPVAGVGLPRRARHGHQRSGEPEGRARLRRP